MTPNEMYLIQIIRASKNENAPLIAAEIILGYLKQHESSAVLTVADQPALD